MSIHDISRPFMLYFRTKRMKIFSNIFKINKSTHIIDIGGTEFNWKLIFEKPKITMVNIRGEAYIDGRFEHKIGDATELKLKDNSYDIAYSNSVIEHVGDWSKQQAFARELRRLAPKYYVQTPNRRFFMEPHYITPFVHWFPKSVRQKILRYGSVWGLIKRPSPEKIKKMVDEIELLDIKQMHELFPDAVIKRERFLGMTKSLIAVKI